jgi:hypothetical protein
VGIITAEAVMLFRPRFAAGSPAQSASHALTRIKKPSLAYPENNARSCRAKAPVRQCQKPTVSFFIKKIGDIVL